MTEKPKTIYKDGLRWNLLPKEVYGKEVYVPCNTLYHYWSLGVRRDGGFRMTEKRFIYKIKNGAMVIIDKKDNVLIRDKYRACDYLNQLNNENEQLKSELISKDDLIQQLKIKLNMDYYNKWKKCNLKYIEICEELLEENKLYKKLSDENEQLKEEIKDLNDILARYEEKELKND